MTASYASPSLGVYLVSIGKTVRRLGMPGRAVSAGLTGQRIAEQHLVAGALGVERREDADEADVAGKLAEAVGTAVFVQIGASHKVTATHVCAFVTVP